MRQSNSQGQELPEEAPMEETIETLDLGQRGGIEHVGLCAVETSNWPIARHPPTECSNAMTRVRRKIISY